MIGLRLADSNEYVTIQSKWGNIGLVHTKVPNGFGLGIACFANLAIYG